VLELVLDARPQRALEDPGVRRACVDRAGDVQQGLARAALDLAPQLVGPAQQHHVGRVLVVGHADDPRLAVRRALVVRHVVALEAEDALPAARQVVGRRAPHAAHADDDRVVAVREGRAEGASRLRARAHHRDPSARSGASVALARMRAPAGSKKGVGVTVAGTGRPATVTSSLRPGQACETDT
jgi:hypothetical protein